MTGGLRRKTEACSFDTVCSHTVSYTPATLNTLNAKEACEKQGMSLFFQGMDEYFTKWENFL